MASAPLWIAFEGLGRVCAGGGTAVATAGADMVEERYPEINESTLA